jgi:hypothetical protein
LNHLQQKGRIVEAGRSPRLNTNSNQCMFF